MAKGGITIAVGVIAFVVAIAILGVSIAILINVTKKDKSSNDEPTATSRICPDIIKSSLPLATLPYAYDAVCNFRYSNLDQVPSLIIPPLKTI